MNRFKKLFGFFVKSLFLICLILSCQPKKSKPSSRPRPIKETFICVEEGKGCWQFPICRSFCEDLFFNKDKRQECYAWPMVLFEDFRNLIDSMNNESFQYLEPEVLKCFLEFTEDDKTILVEKFSEEEAKEFLEEVANNGTLAFYLAEKDKADFSILDTLFKKIDNRIAAAIGESLFEGKNFLILIHQWENRSAWIWLNDYIIYKCRRDEHCDEPLEYYCKILENTGTTSLKDFFENQYFEKEYEREIESKTCNSNGCEYGDLRDFNDMCDDI